ncbi:hypothetical protein GCM10010975_29130 [Comamonas phosphati]|nr:hypothetical protein GCM10010975_29130 [Comamonas phosphati]
MRIILEDPYERDIFHGGEREAQRRFGVEAEAREMKGSIGDQLSAGNAGFIASQPFCFVSVREDSGAIHTQILACVTTAQGTYPLVAFGDARQFFFLLSQAEGERLLERAERVCCKVGMIFVDFARRARLRINGRLQQAGEQALPGFQCPPLHHLMQVHVEQVYANCQARIVRLQQNRPG